ncbi:MAG: T9SS type A sorting domain-containing protein, partial [Bacteroidia bacterium]
FNYTSTNIMDNKTQIEPTIFPNPTNSTVTIRVANGSYIHKISILDLLGKVVIEKEAENKSQEMFINLELLQNGIYFIKLNDYDSALKKIIKY